MKTLRISFGKGNTENDVKDLVKAISTIVKGNRFNG
jgi:cysteine sulfinate desulfinase/cysteine desulfurase-like protein